MGENNNDRTKLNLFVPTALIDEIDGVLDAINSQPDAFGRTLKRSEFIRAALAAHCVAQRAMVEGGGHV